MTSLTQPFKTRHWVNLVMDFEHITFGQGQRWYEKDTEVHRLAVVIENMTPDFQRLVGQSILALLDNSWDKVQKRVKLKQIGAERQIGLLKSQNKRRWYDEDIYLHKAFNRMLILEESQRRQVAIQLNPALELLGFYAHHAVERGIASDHYDALGLLRTVLENSAEEGADLLESWGFPRPVDPNHALIKAQQVAPPKKQSPPSSTEPSTPSSKELPRSNPPTRPKNKLQEMHSGMKVLKQEN